MDIKQNIKNLFEIKTNYAIWKDTGIAQTTLGDYTKGVSDIGNMKLDHALTLNDYYIKNKGAIEMKNIIKQITEGYKVDGENEKYIEFYESYEAIEGDGALDKIEASLNIGQTVEGLQYPVIFFDDSNADSGQLYESSQVDEVLTAASEYFEAK